MAEPLHVIVTLSPETIEALASAINRVPASELHGELVPKRSQRPPSNGGATVALWADALRQHEAFAALKEVTVGDALEALAVPVSRWNHSLGCIAGKALASLGYRVVRRDGSAARARYYSRTP